MGMTYSHETITPKRAKELLTGNEKNRRLTPGLVSFLAEEIRAGRWDANNGETIKLNGKTLIDGQHRLHAVIAAGQPVKMAIMSGVSNDAFDTIDLGKRRSLGDTLQRQGYKYYNYLATAARCYVSLQRGAWANSHYFGIRKGLEIIDKHPKLYSSIEFGCKGGQQRYRFCTKFVGSGIFAATHYRATQIDKTTADYFFDHLLTGADLKGGDAILTLRDFFYSLKTEQLTLRTEGRLLMICKAWNCWRDDTPFKARLKPTDLMKME